MEIKIVPKRDSHNSYVTSSSSGVVLSSDANGDDLATELYVELPDGRKLTMDASKFGRAIRALRIEVS